MNVRPDPYRLARGGRVDHRRCLTFKFNGKRYAGLEGDSLASALLANGVRLVGRSFKYHRPRGIVGVGAEEPNALVQLSGKVDEPNVLATTLPLYDGLEASSVNCWPGVRFDLGRTAELFSRFLPAGFYYKTFMWPNNSWNFYGRFARAAAGLGRAPAAGELGARYEKRYHHCDVLVVGAGPTGLAAALAASKHGARVMLVDEQVEAGGNLLNEYREIDGKPALEWVAGTVESLSAAPDVLHLQRTTAAGYYDHNMLYVVQHAPAQHGLRERLWRVRAKQVLIATGAIERPLVFADNDRPGVMLASAAAAYAYRYAVMPGRRGVVVTNNNSGYESAFALRQLGLEVVAILDTRVRVDNELTKRAKDLGIPIHFAHGIVSVKGARRVVGLEAAPLDRMAERWALRCDLICSSGGWNPTLHLQSQSGAKPVYDEGIASFVPGKSVQAEMTVGAAAGEFGLADCLVSGFTAGARAARNSGYRTSELAPPACAEALPLSIEPMWELPSARRSTCSFVDFQNDVTSADIRLALRENYASVELVKRYTTTGMGVDQGKISNVNVIGVISQVMNAGLGDVGTTTYRPPYQPVSFGAWAGVEQGEIILPARRTPVTGWFEQQNANFDEAGALWRRPFQIPRQGETPEQAINREALAVRNGVGIYDGTPLGKIEVNGPDALRLLNRVYPSRWDRLPIGMGKFSVMLLENGRMLDDGIVFRLGAQRYLISTGSRSAGEVHAHLERLLQCEWPDFQVYLTEVTEQWANFCVCGPLARRVIRSAGTDIDLGVDRFPFMGIRTGRVAGFAVRVAKVSYTGELSFEVNVRARDGLALWEALMHAGAPHGITPVGSETSLLLRLEKGFVAAWAEGDGCANLDDLGMSWVIDRSKTDFIGKRSMDMFAKARAARPQIVGLVPEDPEFVPPDGTPLVDADATEEAEKMIGHVSTGGYSAYLGHSIALAQLADGRDRIGDVVTLWTKPKRVVAWVTEPVFVDPAGGRMRG